MTDNILPWNTTWAPSEALTFELSPSKRSVPPGTMVLHEFGQNEDGEAITGPGLRSVDNPQLEVVRELVPEVRGETMVDPAQDQELVFQGSALKSRAWFYVPPDATPGKYRVIWRWSEGENADCWFFFCFDVV